MRIALVQLNYIIGDFEGNTRKIIRSIERAKEEKANLVIFSELCVCGYPPRDFLEFKDFISLTDNSIQRIIKHTKDIAVIIGAPTVNDIEHGKDLYNSAFFVHNRKLKTICNKTLLPTYDVFDEYRYFEPARENKPIDFMEKKIALTICEDIWNADDNPLYYYDPVEKIMKTGKMDLLINISASPFSRNWIKKRDMILSRTSKKYKVPSVFVNQAGANTELIFDGSSTVMTKEGKVFYRLKSFEEDFYAFDFEELENARPPKTNIPSEISLIHDALILGIKDYFQKSGFQKANIGLSGGIDSAVTLVLAQRALGSENVFALLMPSQYSSEHSVDDSEILCKNLGVNYETIPINEFVDLYDKTLSYSFKGAKKDVTEENLQARTRANLLMAIANKKNYILLNTSNKSELAVGYGTLYGDMSGGLSVLGDVYKTDVYNLARFINKSSAVIPKNILEKHPSAELRPNQKDQDTLPPYGVLDKILFEYIENRRSPSEIIQNGNDDKIVRYVLRMVNRTEYKRYQTPPILRVSNKAFGMGRRVPMVGRYLE